MTSPSLRKHTITLRSMLRSKCVNAFVAKAALCVASAFAAWPVWAVEQEALPVQARTTVSQDGAPDIGDEPALAEEPEDIASPPETPVPRAPARKPVRKTAPAA